MKFSKYVLMAAGCALFAACSSDEPLATTVDNAQQQPVSGSTGFASFDINLPTVAGTGSRATTDEEGTPTEYAVYNGKVLVFQKGATEGDAKFVCMGDLSGMRWSDAAAGEVTTSSSSVARLDNINLKDNDVKYAAVVVLNYTDDFVFPAIDQTFTDWSTVEQTSPMLIKDNGGAVKYITMGSAPRYIDASSEPLTLVDIDKTKIAQSEMLITGSAAEIFVQRAVAKVTITTKDSYDVASSSYPGDKVTINAWGLDITNKKSYALQVTTGLAASYSDIWKGATVDQKLNRFYGNGTRFQRAFWAKDLNYDKNITSLTDVAANFNVINSVSGNPAELYCLENTFDVDHQQQGQTTRVVIKASYVPNGFQAGETFFKIGSSTKLWSDATLKAEIEAKAQTLQNSAAVTADIPASFSNAGFHALSEVTISKDGNKLDAAAYTAIADALGLASADEAAIAAYNKGESYYIARVKHFGDEDCPWNIGDPTYGSNSLAYLGRYGMVRNNWYEVNVNSISNPGSPSVPVIKPTDWDDENEYYISVTVNILSWAKRVHNVDL